LSLWGVRERSIQAGGACPSIRWKITHHSKGNTRGRILESDQKSKEEGEEEKKVRPRSKNPQVVSWGRKGRWILILLESLRCDEGWKKGWKDVDKE